MPRLAGGSLAVTVGTPLIATRFPDIPLFRTGKVRDVYLAGSDELVIVATDRISAFDYVLGSGIPGKGRILSQLSAYWFEQLADIVPNHLLSTDIADFPAEFQPHTHELRGRSMLVRRTTPVPIECVARGYLSGSGWKEYRQHGTVCGIALPPGLNESDQLPRPIFTPATKAESGHDENISAAQAAVFVGDRTVARLRELTLALYDRASRHAEGAGLILADTKFEFGWTGRPGESELILIDEALTPDSSRYWPQASYAPGGPQPSFDKQYVRDYLDAIHWNRQPPVPMLPDEVVARTREKYLEAFHLLTGRELR
jgi:phosphoribosylaminoimidazole-succinocarboxamide synthase